MGREERKSRSKRAGLIFPVAKIHKFFCKGRYAEHIAAKASVYLAAVLEYIIAELLEIAGDVTSASKGVRITPRYLQLAIRKDTEFNTLLSNVIIPEGGVVPNIQAASPPNIMRKGIKTESPESDSSSED